MFNSFKVFFIGMGTVFLKDKLIFLESGKPDKFCVYTVYYWKNQSCPTWDVYGGVQLKDLKVALSRDF